jgi:ribosome-binding factor A
MQASINRQMHARKTPILSFKPDEVIRAAERIEQVLRENKERLARLNDEDSDLDQSDA